MEKLIYPFRKIQSSQRVTRNHTKFEERTILDSRKWLDSGQSVIQWNWILTSLIEKDNFSIDQFQKLEEKFNSYLRDPLKFRLWSSNIRSTILLDFLERALIAATFLEPVARGNPLPYLESAIRLFFHSPPGRFARITKVGSTRKLDYRSMDGIARSVAWIFVRLSTIGTGLNPLLMLFA